MHTQYDHFVPTYHNKYNYRDYVRVVLAHCVMYRSLFMRTNNVEFCHALIACQNKLFDMRYCD
jgi:hypothetical protein